MKSSTSKSILLALIVFGVSFGVGYISTKPLGIDIANLFIYEKRSAVIGETAIVAIIADTPKKRMKGLGGRDELGELEGMFFEFPKKDFHGIWMKDMMIPIDILWINEFYEVVHIEKNISPKTYPKIFKPKRPAKYVLEVNAGFADEHALRVGDWFTSL